MHKDSNYYYIDGKPYVRATVPASILNKPGLNKWLANVGQDKADEWTEETREIGVQVHDYIHRLVRGEDMNTPAMGLEWAMLDPRIRNGIQSYRVAQQELGFEPVKSELFLINHTYQYAGTTDLLAKWNGGNYLFDWKVSGRLWPEVKFQLAAYYTAWESECDTNERLDGCMAVRLDRDTGKWRPKNRNGKVTDMLLMGPDEAEEVFENLSVYIKNMEVLT